MSNRGVDVDKAIRAIGNKFDMILIASERARELSKNFAPKVPSKNGPILTALREVEAGVVGQEYLAKVGKRKTQKYQK